jgi:hypothetical protein
MSADSGLTPHDIAVNVPPLEVGMTLLPDSGTITVLLCAAMNVLLRSKEMDRVTDETGIGIVRSSSGTSPTRASGPTNKVRLMSRGLKDPLSG